MEYEVENIRPVVRPKKTCCGVVEKDCHGRQVMQSARNGESLLLLYNMLYNGNNHHPLTASFPGQPG